MKRALAVAAALALAGCTPPPQAPRSAETRAPTTVLRDALILSGVKAKLIGDDPDSTTTVAVSVANGIVTLSGSVHDAGVRRRLVASARGSAGVEGVVDRLRIDPHGPRLKERVADLALAARVEAAITAQLGLQHIAVRVERGVATLDGTVADAKTKRTILATARATSGVRNVVDRIRVGVP